MNRLNERLNRLEDTTGGDGIADWNLHIQIGGGSTYPRTYAHNPTTGETSTDADLINRLRKAWQSNDGIGVNIGSVNFRWVDADPDSAGGADA